MFTNENKFLLEFDHPVEAVIVTERDADHTEGYVLCDISHVNDRDSYVVWAFTIRNREVATTYWGHYTDDRDDALRNLFARTGFGQVKALS